MIVGVSSINMKVNEYEVDCEYYYKYEYGQECKYEFVCKFDL